MPFGLTWRQTALLLEIAPRVVEAVKREAPLIRELATIFEKETDVAPETHAKQVGEVIRQEVTPDEIEMMNRSTERVDGN